MAIVDGSNRGNIASLDGLGWAVKDYVQIQIAHAFFDSKMPKTGWGSRYNLLPRTLAPLYAAAAVVGGGATVKGLGFLPFAAAAGAAKTALPVLSKLGISKIFGSSRPSGAEKRTAARKGSGPVIAQVRAALSRVATMLQQRGYGVPATAPAAFVTPARLALHAIAKAHSKRHHAWRCDISANMLIEWAEGAARALQSVPVRKAGQPSPIAAGGDVDLKKVASYGGIALLAAKLFGVI